LRKTSKTLPEWVDSLIANYTNIQMSRCRNVVRCVECQSPSLAVMRKEYGEKVVETFVIVAIYDLSEFVGCREKITEFQAKQTAQMILGQYYYLKVTEIMLFFYWLKCGRYGEFYGTVDGQKILGAFTLFLRDRQDIRRKIEREKENERLEAEKKNALTFEEWIDIKITIAMYNSEYVMKW